jgi:hypothetical protein
METSHGARLDLPGRRPARLSPRVQLPKPRCKKYQSNPSPCPTKRNSATYTAPNKPVVPPKIVPPYRTPTLQPGGRKPLACRYGLRLASFFHSVPRTITGHRHLATGPQLASFFHSAHRTITGHRPHRPPASGHPSTPATGHRHLATGIWHQTPAAHMLRLESDSTWNAPARSSGD